MALGAFNCGREHSRQRSAAHHDWILVAGFRMRFPLVAAG